MKKIVSPFIIPLAFSLILHSILIAGVFRLGFFDFIHDQRDTPITALLIAEKISRPLIPSKRVTGFSGTPAGSAERREPFSAQDKPSSDSGNSLDLDDKTVNQKSIEKSVPAGDALEVPAPSVSQTPPPRKVTDLTGAPNSTENNSAGTDSATDMSAASALSHSDKIEKTSLLKMRREKLLYSLYWLDIYVGRAVIEATSREDRITIKSHVHSTPFISVFYKVEDYAESTVVGGEPVKFRIKQHEGKYRSDKETVFDPDRKQVTFFNYIKGTTDDHPINTPEVWDLISGFYYLRTQLIEVGKTIYIDVFDSNKFFRSEVSVIGKERIKLSATDEVDTIKVKPVIKSEGLFQNSGEVLIWLTDDDNKTPVKIETKVPIGKIVAVLTSQETE